MGDCNPLIGGCRVRHNAPRHGLRAYANCFIAKNGNLDSFGASDAQALTRTACRSHAHPFPLRQLFVLLMQLLPHALPDVHTLPHIAAHSAPL